MKGSTGFALGFVAGLGTGILVKDHLGELQSAASPALRFLLRSGVVAAERSREGLARFGEMLQDLFAEVQSDLKGEKKRPAKRAKKKTAKRKRREGRQAEVIPLRSQTS